ncbi:phosphotransferase [archaeon]|jgi:Ser/Thr protein kinase RdoA (MazF antagonist)/beta-phosphoglucomutase-like phosphatase (HAD superfamily)|nr:phosphotransferase [archaeon]MBT6761829.1 phosphotransferase [archaeon]
MKQSKETQLSQETINQVSKIFGKQLRLVETDKNETKFTFNFKSSLILLKDDKNQEYILKEVLSDYLNFYGTELFLKGLSQFIDSCNPLKNQFLTYNKTITGNYFVKITEPNVQDKHYCLIPFQENEKYNESKDQIQATATAHADMNLKLKNLDPNVTEFFETNFNNGPFLRDQPILDLFSQVELKLENSTKQKNYSKKFMRNLKLGLDLAKTQLEKIPDNLFQNLPKQLTHKDIFPGNILYKQDNSVTIIDPDEFMYITRLRDVVYALWCFGARRADASLISPNPEIMKIYLDSYQQIDSLTTEEIRLIPQMAIRIWVEDLLNFALNVEFTENQIYELERKVQHLKNAISGQTVLKLIKYDLIIFDFDGTIGKLDINWKSLKTELATHFKNNHNKIVDFTGYSTGCTLAYDLLGEVGFQDCLPISKRFEEAGLSGVTFNNKAIRYVKSFSGKKVVWTSNFASIVHQALKTENIDEEFITIIGREQTRRLKPELDGYNVLSNIFEQKNLQKINPKKTLFIGNSLSDSEAAEKIGCEYLDISQL